MRLCHSHLLLDGKGLRPDLIFKVLQAADQGRETEQAAQDVLAAGNVRHALSVQGMGDKKQRYRNRKIPFAEKELTEIIDQGAKQKVVHDVWDMIADGVFPEQSGVEIEWNEADWSAKGFGAWAEIRQEAGEILEIGIFLDQKGVIKDKSPEDRVAVEHYDECKKTEEKVTYFHDFLKSKDCQAPRSTRFSGESKKSTRKQTNAPVPHFIYEIASGCKIIQPPRLSLEANPLPVV